MAETLAAILEREPDWERLPSNVPAGIRRVLRRCLERDPRRRLHHIADARIEIEDAANDPEAKGLGSGDGVDSPPRASAWHLDRGAGAGVGRGAGRLVPAPACGGAGAAGRRDHDAADVRSMVLCGITRRAAHRVRGRPRGPTHAVGARPRRARARAPCRARKGRAGHSGRPTAARSGSSRTAS